MINKMNNPGRPCQGLSKRCAHQPAGSLCSAGQLLDDIDKRLFHLAQSEFPISDRPYRDLGKRLGLNEAETIARLRKLKKMGFIRRIGPVWDAKSLGYASQLMAFKIPASRVEAAAQIVGRGKGVTHNYLRKASYNLWFTLTAPNQKALQAQVARLVHKVKPRGFLELPAIKIYKIGVKLEA